MSSERTGWLPILLSIVAICISCLSWWESRRARVINQEVNRPFLVISHFVTATAEVQNGIPVMGIKVTLQNNGRTPALLYRAVVDGQLEKGIDEENRCQIQPYNNEYKPTALEILPGFQESVDFDAKMTKGCDEIDALEFRIIVQVTYKEPGTGVEYSQTLRTDPFELPNFRKNKKLPSPSRS